MSGWFVINNKEIQHSNGYKLILNAGSWKEPEDLRPTIPNEFKVNPHRIVRYMREGLQFASENAC